MKHLIYLIDGTWVYAGDNRSQSVLSNVYKLNMMMDTKDNSGNAQIIHYVRGLGGTQGIRKYTEGGFSYGVNETVDDIYINICSNYEPGDQIYIFGFSRGAVIARAVTGLLSYGILYPNRIEYIKYIRLLFNSRHNNASQEELKAAEIQVEKRSYPNAPVKFLGVFDTVVGGRNRTRRLQELNLHRGLVAPCVDTAVQILALDESRSFFHPLPWNGVQNVNTKVEQIWLPGVHSDVGGTYTHNFLGDVSLAVMIDRILHSTDLSIDTNYIEERFDNIDGDELRVNDELESPMWRAFSWGNRSKRSQGVFEEYIHPFVRELENSFISYKKESKRVPYQVPDTGLKEANYFQSAQLQGQRFAIAT
jgi:uncharacterized protein (DUF2235 family)